MARGEIFTARIESIAAGGAGIARLEGKSVFIEFTAPGDLVKFGIVNEKKSWAEGELLEILEPSPFRKKPECGFYGLCGGCALQHLDYEVQIKAKTAILGDAFRRIGGLDPALVPQPIKVHRSAPYEYRNRVQFHINNDTGDESGGKPGFKKRKSASIVPVDDCPVADPGIRKALKEGKFLTVSKKEKFNVYSRENTFLVEGGQEAGKVSILGREMNINVKLFFQSNAGMLELLITDLMAVAQEADNNLPMADIYSGIGTFASFLNADSRGNKRFPRLDLVEENKASLDLAGENIPSGVNANYYALTDTAWVKLMAKKNNAPFGFIVLDPPRNGLSAQLRQWLAKKGPELAAYVSCDPATLARDSRYLIEGGYTLKDLTMYDFYPQTAHIESLAVFQRKSKK